VIIQATKEFCHKIKDQSRLKTVPIMLFCHPAHEGHIGLLEDSKHHIWVTSQVAILSSFLSFGKMKKKSKK
jgi:hypothetical protein